MAALQIEPKCSHTSVYAPLLTRSAPCPEPLAAIFETGSKKSLHLIIKANMFIPARLSLIEYQKWYNARLKLLEKSFSDSIINSINSNDYLSPKEVT